MDWYHTIELTPGAFTPGCDFANIATTRAVLRRVDVTGQACLDIGTMDGLVAVLLARRGARRVVAVDRLDRQAQIDEVRARLGVSFDYRPGLPIRALPALVEAAGPFDVVVLSGVLYHALDPLAVLAAARGVVRTGGILVVETAAVDDDAVAMHFNAWGRFYPGDNYWLPTTAGLDYVLRWLRLRPLGVAHHHQFADRRTGEHALHRVAVACRAESDPVAGADDDWMRGTGAFELDLAPWIAWPRLASDQAPVAWTGSGCAGGVAAAVRAAPETREPVALALQARD